MTALLDAINAEIRDREEQARRLEDQLRQVGGQLDKLAQLHRLAQGLEAGEAPDPSGETPSPSPPPRGNGAAGNGGGPGASPAPKPKHGTAGEAPGTRADSARVDGSASVRPAGPDAANVPPGVSPARSVPKKRPAARQRPAQGDAAGPDRPSTPAPRSREAGEANRKAALAAVQAGCTRSAEIVAATGIPAGSLLRHLQMLVEQGLIIAEGTKSQRRYRPAGTQPPAAAPPSPASAPKPAQPQPAPDGDGLRRRQQAQVLDTIHEHHPIRAAEIMKRTGIGQGGLVTALARLSERDIIRKDRKTGEWAPAPAPASRNGAPVGHGSPAGGQGPSLQGRVLEAVIYRPRPAAELARDLQEPQAAVEEELARLEADGDIICRPDQSFAPAIRGGGV